MSRPIISESSKARCGDWGEVAVVRMIAASSSLGRDKMMEGSDIKMPERKYIIPPDEDSDEDDNDALEITHSEIDDAEEITLSEMEVDNEEDAQSADEETAGREEEEQNENEEEVKNTELLEVSTEEGGWEEGDLGSDLGVLEPEVELLEVSSEEVDLGLGGEFDSDEDMEEALVIDEEDEEREVGDEKEDNEGEEVRDEKRKSGGSDEYKPLELLPAGWKFKENPRHDGGTKVFFPQYPMKGWYGAQSSVFLNKRLCFPLRFL